MLGNSLRNSDLHMGNNFTLRDGSGGYSDHSAEEHRQNFDGSRDDVIRYDSPSIYGFILSASWGDDDYADIALRFKKEWNSVRVAAAIAYQWDDTNDASTTASSIANSDFTVLSGSISLMHVPTGIYGAFAAGKREYDNRPGCFDFWYAQLGIERKFLPYGSTTIYGEYGDLR